MRRMNLQQTSYLLLLKDIHCLGKLNGEDFAAALSFAESRVYLPLFLILILFVPILIG